MDALTPAPQNLLTATPNSTDLIEAFLSGKSPKTIDAYARDLRTFMSFLNVTTVDEAARVLLSNGCGSANLLALRWRDDLTGKGLAPATINRHLAALRSLVALARTLGIVPWALEVKSVKSTSLRDTRGCGLDGFKALLSVARKQRNDAKSARDVAILRLLFDLGLRRGEVVSLDVADVDLAGDRVMVIGKGKLEKAPITLPDQTKQAIQEWLQCRGDEAGALFPNMSRDKAKAGARLSDSGLYTLVVALGKRAKIRARPHGLRHAAITEVLNLMNGNIRVAQKFARHASPNTTVLYDDNRTDLAGDAAKRLAARADT